ncbi:MAG: NADH-quinone oxidoreductase subunit M, partial [Alphaproteobacteria bacterium CG_4_10_14_0_8_um_filter_53_9]
MLTLLILLPLLASLITWGLPARAAKSFALLASLVPLGQTAYLLTHFDKTATGFQFTENIAWLPSLGASWSLGLDGLSLLMVALTALLIPLCLLASWKETRRTPAFFAAFLALEAAVLGLFCSLDMLLFYVFWEAMLIPMFLLIGLWGGENRVYATLKFFLYTFVGSVLMLVAIMFLWSHAGGTFSIPALITVGQGLPASTQNWLFLAFFAAFAVKVPMWPFHTWLPDAHVQAPTAGSVILAGVLL